MAAADVKPADDVADIIAESDTGARNPKDGFSRRMLWWNAFAIWSERWLN